MSSAQSSGCSVVLVNLRLQQPSAPPYTNCSTNTTHRAALHISLDTLRYYPRYYHTKKLLYESGKDKPQRTRAGKRNAAAFLYSSRCCCAVCVGSSLRNILRIGGIAHFARIKFCAYAACVALLFHAHARALVRQWYAHKKTEWFTRAARTIYALARSERAHGI